MKTIRKMTGKKKRQFDEPDEFQSLTQKVLGYVQGHRTQAYGALAAVAVAIVLTILVSMLMRSSEQKVLAMQNEALKYYDVNSPVPGDKPMTPQERYKKAGDIFDTIVKEHGGSPMAQNALYYKANVDMKMGNEAAAMDGYRKLVDGSGKDPVLWSLSNLRLAEGYTAKNDTEKATGVYKEMVSSANGYLKDEARYRLAKLYEGMGKKDDAVKEYEAIKKDFPKSPWAGEAGTKIAEITGKPLPAPAGQAKVVPMTPVKPAGVPVKK